MSQFMFQNSRRANQPCSSSAARGSTKEYGFTLVELAISLMIIGLLLVGVLKGQELIENSRVASVIRQAQSIDAAVATFQESYNVLPGDMTDPAQRIAGCTAANCTVAGNGDGVIGTPIAVTGGGTFSTVATGENRSFWFHLGQTRLISGISLGYADVTAVNYGVNFPQSALGGGFWVGNYISNAGDTVYSGGLKGHYLILRRGAIGDMQHANFGTEVATAHQAAMIDRKLDDGLANQGTALGVYPNSGNLCTRWIDAGTNQMGYAESVRPTPVCSMALSMQN